MDIEALAYYETRETYVASAEEKITVAGASGVSWPAVFGGTVVTVAAALVLILLGSGFGLAWVSPLSWNNPSLVGFTLTMAVWLIVVQWVTAGVGGYIAGRLRSRWIGTHGHEVFFRDTAHGLLTWSASTLVIVGLAAALSSGILGAGVRAAATVAGEAAKGATQSALPGLDVNGYNLDRLLRSTHPDTANTQAADVRSEAARILAKGLITGTIPEADRTYLNQVVASATGASQPDAQKRVDDIFAEEKAAADQAKQAVDTARKAASRAAIFTALSMLIGAFISCVAAAFGGSLRDEHP